MNIYFKKLFFIAVGLTIIIVIGSGVYLAYKQNKKEKTAKEQNVQQVLDIGNKLYSDGKFNEFIVEIEKILNNNNGVIDTQQQNKAKALLAWAYFNKNATIDDRIKAVQINKSIINNSSSSERDKANALIALGDYYHRNDDEDFARRYIFNDGEFAKILKESDDNIELSIEKLYEWSNEFYPTAIAYYQIGNYYCYLELLSIEGKNPRLITSIREQYIANVKEMLRQGDELFTQTNASYAYNLRTRILACLYAYDAGPTKEEIEDDYQKTISLYQSSERLYTKTNLILTVYFQYASFIAEFEGEKGTSKIKSIIKPAISGFNNPETRKADFYNNFLRNISKPEMNFHYRRRRALLIAKYVPEFKYLLKQLGWTNEQLNIKITPLGEQAKYE